MKAVRCPVCAGTGEYYVGGLEDGKLIDYRACHGCKDKDGISRGWVEVHDNLMFSSEPIIPLESYPGAFPPEDWPEPFYITGDITVSMRDPATG